MQGPIILAAGAIASETGVDRVEEILISKRFCEELYGTALHRLYGHRDVAMRRDENDGQLPVHCAKVALKLKAAPPRHSNVKDQTGRAIREVGFQEVGNTRKLLGIEADRPQQAHNRIAKLGIVVDD